MAEVDNTKRRLSVGFSLGKAKRAKGKVDDDTVFNAAADLEVNDDEAEKRNRRKSRNSLTTSMDDEDEDEDEMEMDENRAPENGNGNAKGPRKSLGGFKLPILAPIISNSNSIKEKALNKEKRALNDQQLSDLYSACIKLSSENASALF